MRFAREMLGRPPKRTEAEATEKARELQRRNWQAQRRLEVLEKRADLHR